MLPGNYRIILTYSWPILRFSDVFRGYKMTHWPKNVWIFSTVSIISTMSASQSKIKKIRNFSQKIKSFRNLDNKWLLFCSGLSGCECNGHSDACVYDIKKDYGVCVDCQHNTRGDKCDTCSPGYYRNATKLITSTSVCICKSWSLSL